MRHRPSIPNNIQHWQVFEEDEQVRKFLEMVDNFAKIHADQENQNDPTWIMQEGEYTQEFQNKIPNHRMLVLKNNQIPKGLIPLEMLFNHDEIPFNSTLHPKPEEVEDCDIGNKENLRLVKLSKDIPPDIKIKYAKFLRKYKDVFTWSYDELRTYDTSIMEHKIPLKHVITPKVTLDCNQVSLVTSKDL
jgi:hypothetical protein